MVAHWTQTGGQWGYLQIDDSLSFVNFQGLVCGVLYGSKPGSVSLWVSDVRVWVKGRRWFADPSAVFPIGICGASIT